ncbi:hypothetical protein AUP68_13792 [Ilyonectria robusta]
MSTVTSPEDVSIAIQHGVDGLIISNHGGRQLDTTPATVDILREVAPVARGKIRLAIDGGIRRGSDIFKAIAIGADFVFVGRIAIWGLAVISLPPPSWRVFDANMYAPHSTTVPTAWEMRNFLGGLVEYRKHIDNALNTGPRSFVAY